MKIWILQIPLLSIKAIIFKDLAGHRHWDRLVREFGPGGVGRKMVGWEFAALFRDGCFRMLMVGTVDGSEILHQLTISLSHYVQGFIHPRWLFRISSMNSMKWDGSGQIIIATSRADLGPPNGGLVREFSLF